MITGWIISNGDEVSVYDSEQEFLDAIADLVNSNERCTLSFEQRENKVYAECM